MDVDGRWNVQEYLSQWTNRPILYDVEKEASAEPDVEYDPCLAALDNTAITFAPNSPSNYSSDLYKSPDYAPQLSPPPLNLRSSTPPPPPSAPPTAPMTAPMIPTFILKSLAAGLDSGRLWALDIAKLIEGVEPRLKVRDLEDLSLAADTSMRANQGVFLLDCSLLRLIPTALLDTKAAASWSHLVQQQVDELRLKMPPSGPPTLGCPFTKFGVPVFDLDRQGFTGLSGQVGVAAVPVLCVRIERDQLLLDLSHAVTWSAAKVHAAFLQQTAMLCRAVTARDVPTLSRLACAFVDTSARMSATVFCQNRVVLSTKHATIGHPVLRTLKNDEKGLRSALHGLALTVRQQGGPEQYTQQFLQYNSAAVSSSKHLSFVTGVDCELLSEAWGLDLEKVERAEAEAVVACRGQVREPGRDPAREHPRAKPYSKKYHDGRRR